MPAEYLLKEDGGKLLQEDGGGILLESSTPAVDATGGGVPWPIPNMPPLRETLNRPTRFYPTPEGEPRPTEQEVLLAARPLVIEPAAVKATGSVARITLEAKPLGPPPLVLSHGSYQAKAMIEDAAALTSEAPALATAASEWHIASSVLDAAPMLRALVEKQAEETFLLTTMPRLQP